MSRPAAMPASMEIAYPSQIVGRQMLARFQPEDCATVTDAFLALASGAESETIITYRSEVAGRPGEYRWLEANCGLVRNDAEMPSEVIASIRDVTVEKRLEEDLRRARERAENAAAATAAVLANMRDERIVRYKGAKDYIRKPFDAARLVGPAEALMKRDVVRN